MEYPQITTPSKRQARQKAAFPDSGIPNPQELSEYLWEKLEDYELMNAFFTLPKLSAQSCFLPIFYQLDEDAPALALELWLEGWRNWTLYLSDSCTASAECLQAAHDLARLWSETLGRNILVEVSEKPLISEAVVPDQFVAS